MPAIAIGLCSVLGVASSSVALLQGALALSAALLLCVVCFRAPSFTIIALVVWLAVLATIRRMLLGAGAGGDQDVLLLVGPVTVGVLVAVGARAGAFRSLTPLAKGVLVLSALVTMSALNPLQGGPTVGLAGLLFVLVPMLWFWIGRSVVDDRLLKVLLSIVAGLAVGGAVYGLFQVYRGFPTWDATWIEQKGFISLRVGDAYRQFASFASTTEYVGYLAIAALVWALRFRPGRVAPAAAALALLTWALLLASSRAILVLLPIALGAMFAARRGYGLVKALIMGMVGLAVLGALVSFAPGTLGGNRTSQLLERQIEGLSDPLNDKVSTLPIHLQQLGAGLTNAIRNPIGQGVGSTTIAAEKFGGNTFSTETDPSNIAVALGIPGLAAYCFVVAASFMLAFRMARDRRDFLSLAALGILVVTSLQWLNGGNYAIAPFPWLVLGWLDQRRLKSTAPPPELQEQVPR
ncbi:MAG: hypothetical protein ACRD12_17285 [Acidimicrobiales bacterium]